MSLDSIGKLRILIQDEDPNKQIFDDPTLDFFLEQEGGDLKMAAALAYETLSAKLGRLPRRSRVHLVNVDRGDIAERLRAQAEFWRDEARRKPSAFGTTLSVDTDDIKSERERFHLIDEFDLEVFTEDF